MCQSERKSLENSCLAPDAVPSPLSCEGSCLVLFGDKALCPPGCTPALSPGFYLSFDPVALCRVEDFTMINLNKYVSK